MTHDLRVAWRFLRRSPVSTALAVVTLAVTVAICSVAVGLADETFWRPLSLEQGERLVTIYNARLAPRSSHTLQASEGGQFQVLAFRDYVELRDRLQNDVDLAAFCRIFQTLGDPDQPIRVQGELVSGNYFTVLGAKPFVGKLIAPDDDRMPSGHPLVVLGYDLWRRTFASDPGVIGKSIRLNRSDYTVAGVAPRNFRGPAYPSQFWIPLTMAARAFGGQDVLANPAVPLFQTIGLPRSAERAPHVTERVRGIETFASRDGWRLTALPASHLRFWPAYRAAVRRFVGIFVALGICVLTIACANLAGMLLGRNGERRRDLAVRQALGASRVQIFRRLGAESVILTVLGGGVGVLLAYAAAASIGRIAVPAPAHIALTPDVRLVVISLAISLVASFVFTAIFAVKGMDRDIRGALSSTAVTITSNNGLQRVLVIAQIAASCVCLTAAGLLQRSAAAVDRIDVGLDTSHSVMGMIGIGDQGYTPADGAAFYQRLQDRLESAPQVDAVALEWTAVFGSIRGNGRVSLNRGEMIQVRYNAVSSGYFRALRIPLLAGREFERTDRDATEPVAVVNETLAARIGADAIGSTLTLAPERTPRRIVGIAREVKYNGITEPPQPFVYAPLAQMYRPDAWIHLRTLAADAETLLRATLRTLDPDVALSDVHTLKEQLDAATAMPRTAARVSGLMAAIAAFLAVIGVYGLLAAAVDQRRRELSIRAALGASPRDIVATVVMEGLWLTVAGLALGTVVGLTCTSVLSAFLYGVSPRDPAVFAAAPIALFGASVVAWFAPARRAAKTDLVAILKTI